MSAAPVTKRTSNASQWLNLRMWVKRNQLSRGFWIYFLATFFFDAGFCIYFFLFNLYLLDLHFNERFIGLVSGVSTVGTMLVMFPAGMLIRKFGVRPVMIGCYLVAPLVQVARVLWVQPQAQIGLALFGGMALASSGVCYLPTVARLTTEKNRTTAYTLIFAASLASSAVGGLLCSYFSHWISLTGMRIQPVTIKQIILLASCFVAALAVIPAIVLRVPPPQEHSEPDKDKGTIRRLLRFSPALLRALLPVTLWAVVLAAFFPFGNIYLERVLHLSLPRISVIFSTAQIAQLVMLAFTPVILRRLGLSNGLLAIQIATAATLAVLAGTHRESLAIVLFLLFSALQWMANPGLYDLAMTNTPDAQREYVAAALLFGNALVSALTTPAVGALYTRFGYRSPMIGIALLAFLIAAVSQLLLRTRFSSGATEQQPGCKPRLQPQ